jgi:hypothetical protein
VGKIRFVGRARGGRCVYCHDALADGEAARCPECRAGWHPDCGATLSRCPTRGCSGPAPGRTAPAPSRRRATATAGPRTPPGALARFGPYARLAISAVATTAGLLLSIIGILGMLATLARGDLGRDPGETLLAFLILFAVCSVVAVLTSRWLVRLPATWVEVHRLLNEARPVQVRLRVSVTGSGKHRRYWADVEGPDGERAHFQLDGLLPPWWLLRGSMVYTALCYGWPPPGPYVFEFSDGWLALVQPD